MTVPSVVTWYEIAAPGIDRIEGESEFKPRERYAGININAAGSNVITLGDGNVVNANYSELHTALDKLKEELANAADLSEAEKLDVSVDIESIKDQLAKPSPNNTVVNHLWSGVEKVVTAVGLFEAVEKIRSLIAPLLS